MPYDYEQVSEDVLEKLRYAKSELDILSKGIYDPETQRKLDESLKLVNEFWGGYDKWDSLRVKEQEEQKQTELEKLAEQLLLADQENQRLRQAMSAQSSQRLETPITNHFAELEKLKKSKTMYQNTPEDRKRVIQSHLQLIKLAKQHANTPEDRQLYWQLLRSSKHTNTYEDRKRIRQLYWQLLRSSKHTNTPEDRKRISPRG